MTEKFLERRRIAREKILQLASIANGAANHYRDVVERPAGLSDTVAAANALLAATDALTAAITDDNA